MESLEEKLLRLSSELEESLNRGKHVLQEISQIRFTDEDDDDDTNAHPSPPPNQLEAAEARVRYLESRIKTLRTQLEKVYKTSFALKVEGFIKTMWAWARGGFKASSLADKRFSMCQACPHFEDPRCTLCGCFMQAKTKIPQASCPVGKWTAEVGGEDTIVTKFLKRTGLKKTDPPQ